MDLRPPWPSAPTPGATAMTELRPARATEWTTTGCCADVGGCLSCEVPAEPRAVPVVRRAIVEFARSRGVAMAVADRIALTVSEAVTNAVLHAYPEGAEGTVRVIADAGDHDLQVVVCDDGEGIQPGRVSPGLGAGLRIIAETSDDFGIAARLPQGLEVWMRFVVD